MYARAIIKTSGQLFCSQPLVYKCACKSRVAKQKVLMHTRIRAVSNYLEIHGPGIFPHK